MGVEEYDSTLYQELVGSLLYLTIIHFNIKSSIEICRKFIHHLQLSHLLAAKIILSYIKGTKEFKILFTKKKKKMLHRYIDSNWVGDSDGAKSTTRFIFKVGRLLIK